jgi:glutathione synthase/RimK-type ligase-like ATP-grasp enzyme
MQRIKRSNKLVVSSPNIKSNALKELANELSERLGYRVWRVTPERVRGRRSASFQGGIDKVVQLTKFRDAGISSPQFSLTVDGVSNLSGRQVVARTLTNASEGRGIVIFEKGQEVPKAPLYTEYIPKKKEFRAHVWPDRNGQPQVIDVVEKRKRRGVEDRNTQVRNTANGYVFCRDNVVVPGDLNALAVSAVQALGRSYGAVDIIWNEKQNKSYVLEVNSRPGMQGTTVKKYAEAILNAL